MSVPARVGPALAEPTPTLVKRLERVLKVLGAVLASIVLFRPWRRTQGIPPNPKRVLVVRPDARVGEALLTTPVLDSLKLLSPPPIVDVLVHPKIARVLRGHPSIDELITAKLSSFGTIRALRRKQYDVVLNCANWTAPSVSPTLVARLSASRGAVVGPRLWPLTWLQTHSLAPRSGTRSEVDQRVHLATAIPGLQPRRQLSFRTPEVGEAVRTFAGSLAPRGYAVVNPGGRLDWRRVPASVFGAAAGALADAGVTPVVTWGPGEEELAHSVAASDPRVRIAPPTSIDELASLMANARLTVCNNTGPMHLSVAVGTPTLGLFVAMDIERWGHAFVPHRMVDLTGLDEAQMSARVVEQVRALGAQPLE